MRLLLIFIVVGVSIASSALAQSTGQGRVAPEPRVACPPMSGAILRPSEGRKF